MGLSKLTALPEGLGAPGLEGERRGAGGWEGTKGISNWKFCNREPCA